MSPGILGHPVEFQISFSRSLSSGRTSTCNTSYPWVRSPGWCGLSVCVSVNVLTAGNACRFDGFMRVTRVIRFVRNRERPGEFAALRNLCLQSLSLRRDATRRTKLLHRRRKSPLFVPYSVDVETSNSQPCRRRECLAEIPDYFFHREATRNASLLHKAG